MIEAGPWRRLGFAAAVSAAAHAAIVGFGDIDPPRVPEDPVPLAVRLVGTPAIAPAAATA
ncbi:MAG: hypothetical protein JWM26_3662, partial [Betaproteobacteria bacterium]|nr:hypothetical protein [Betaproteobacteria bacterium]